MRALKRGCCAIAAVAALLLVPVTPASAVVPVFGILGPLAFGGHVIGAAAKFAVVAAASTALAAVEGIPPYWGPGYNSGYYPGYYPAPLPYGAQYYPAPGYYRGPSDYPGPAYYRGSSYYSGRSYYRGPSFYRGASHGGGASFYRGAPDERGASFYRGPAHYQTSHYDAARSARSYSGSRGHSAYGASYRHR